VVGRVAAFIAIAVAGPFPYMDENTFLDHINIGHYVKERITTDEITGVEVTAYTPKPVTVIKSKPFQGRIAKRGSQGKVESGQKTIIG
jgi:hypothetical protein